MEFVEAGDNSHCFRSVQEDEIHDFILGVIEASESALYVFDLPPSRLADCVSQVTRMPAHESPTSSLAGEAGQVSGMLR